jgi:thymidylate synthase
MYSYEKKYRKLLQEVIKKGIYKEDRTGIGCYSLFNKSLEINVSKYFPILTGRKMFEKTFKTEFEWFINGETNIKRFKEAGVKIWDSWADENGNLGPVYGHQLLNFNSNGYNQLNSLIDSIKTTPNSRRHIISLWNPLQLKEMKLPPCYLYFQFFVENKKLNMFVLQRSGDLIAGIPYDIALFTNFLLYISEKTGYKANKLSLNIIDAHIYQNQLDSADEYLKKNILVLPTYKYKNEQLEIINYNCNSFIKIPIAI